MIHIDGSEGEGGGQVLRTSLALSAVTGEPVRLERIRAGRKQPGLKHQHRACVRAAAAICGAEVDGDELGSTSLTFRPRRIEGGAHEIRVGTAGSAVLVAQTVVPALLHAGVSAHVGIEGGTHVPLAPAFEHLHRAWVTAVARMGARLEARLVRHGFAPEGGGRIEVDVAPGALDQRFDVVDAGPIRALTLVAILGRGLREDVIEREVDAVQAALARPLSVDVVHAGTRGNALALVVERDGSVDVASALGARGVPAERVARTLVDEARPLFDVPVGPHLADQLLLPLALGAGGRFLTTTPTLHATTNAAIIRRFLDVDIAFSPQGDRCLVEVSGRSRGRS